MTIAFFVFAAISAIADFIAIVKEIRKKMETTSPSAPWYSHSISLTVRKILGLYSLGAVTLVLALLGMYNYMRQTQLPVITINESPITEWGSTSQGRVYAVINTRSLAELSKSHSLILASLLDDPTIDRMQDTRIEKSSVFEIEGESIRIELQPSHAFWQRAVETKGSPDGKTLVSIHGVNVLLIAWPKHVSTDNFKTLSDVDKMGGKTLAVRSFMHAH